MSDDQKVEFSPQYFKAFWQYFRHSKIHSEAELVLDN